MGTKTVLEREGKKGMGKMKSLGIVRKVDELGRLVLPIETRKMMDLSPGDGVEMFVDQDKIILKKYQPSCIFCGNLDGVIEFEGKKICRGCIEKLSSYK